MSAYIDLQCEWCAAPVRRLKVTFAKNGPHVFCGKKCFGLNRRQHKSKADKVSAKAAYDRLYRAANLPSIKAKKKAYFQRTYDPVKAAIERKKTMPRHVAYCRRPEYRKKKHAYDVVYNAKRQFGEFGESFLLLKQIESEVGKRMTNYEIRLQQGTLNKMQTRKKALHEKYTR